MKVVLCFSTEQVRDVFSLQNRLEIEKIELISLQLQNGWDPVSGSLSQNYRAADMIIMCIDPAVIREKWFIFLYAFAQGASLPIVFYQIDKTEPPGWMVCDILTDNLISVGATVHDLAEKWLQRKNQNEARERLMNDGYALSPDGMATSIREGNAAVVKNFLRYGISPNARDHSGVTMLGTAVRNRHKIIADMLIVAGADVNMISLDRGNTALMDACSIGDMDLVQDILKKKPELDIKSKNGQTALILALGGKFEEISQLLISGGCNAEIADELGMTAKGYAKLFKMQKIVALLE